MFGLLVIPMLLAITLLWLGVRNLRRRGRRSPFNEKLLRAPGHSLDILRTDLTFDALLYLCGVFVLPLFFYVAHLLYAQKSSPFLFLIVGAITVLFCLFKAVTKFNQVIKLHQGVEAEIATGQELNFLMRDGAWVYHDIPYQYGNIDHIIVSRGGVFAVETKGFSKPESPGGTVFSTPVVKIEGDVLVTPNGRAKKPVQQALVHAKWLRDEIQRRFSLSVPVRAVLAFPGWMVEKAFENECWAINPKRGNALRHAVTQNKIEDKDVILIASWIEDLARSIVPKSKMFDSGGDKLFDSNGKPR